MDHVFHKSTRKSGFNSAFQWIGGSVFLLRISVFKGPLDFFSRYWIRIQNWEFVPAGGTLFGQWIRKNVIMIEMPGKWKHGGKWGSEW